VFFSTCAWLALQSAFHEFFAVMKAIIVSLGAGIHCKNWIQIFGYGSIQIFRYLVLLYTLFYKTSPVFAVTATGKFTILVNHLLTSCSMRQPAVALNIDINNNSYTTAIRTVNK